MINQKQFIHNQQNKAVKLSIERRKQFILKNFLLIQSKLDCLLTEDIYRLLGRYSVGHVNRLFGSFEGAVLVYQKSLRCCLKCSKLILKPDWLCESCRHSNSKMADDE
jgi:hypothetical protein